MPFIHSFPHSFSKSDMCRLCQGTGYTLVKKKNNLVSTHVGLSGLMKKPSNKPVIKSNIADGKNVRKGKTGVIRLCWEGDVQEIKVIVKGFSGQVALRLRPKGQENVGHQKRLPHQCVPGSMVGSSLGCSRNGREAADPKHSLSF